MDYAQTLDYLYNRLPMFQKVGGAAYRPGLERIMALCGFLGNPHLAYPVIHVGGTNGKGSVSHYLSAILQESGMRVGLHTSPHLLDFRERIKLNGALCPKEFVVDFVARTRSFFEPLDCSFFEVTVAMAFEYFRQSKVQVAVIEVGMGGRLDSTNVVQPLLSVITNIGLDHAQFLGKRYRDRAFEKAGIIKPGVPCVVGEYQKSTAPVFMQAARERGAPLSFASRAWKQQGLVVEEVSGRSILRTRFRSTDSKPKESGAQSTAPARVVEMRSPLLARYQTKNLRTVLEACVQLDRLRPDLKVMEHLTATQNVDRLTGFKGRWQMLSQEPRIIADTAHNQQGIAQVMEQLRHEDYGQLYWIIGVVGDKDLRSMVALLPSHAHYLVCTPGVARALPASALHQYLTQKGFKAQIMPSMRQALEHTKTLAGPHDLCLISGSSFLVADALQVLGGGLTFEAP